jgi:hypothetical protein
MRLPKRCEVPRQDVPFSEICECQPCRLFRRRASCDQFPAAIIEMLRELFDDLGFALRRKTQRR